MLIRRLASFAISLVGALLLLGGMLYWVFRPAPDMHAAFLTAVTADEPQAVMELLDPALRDEIDEPVLFVQAQNDLAQLTAKVQRARKSLESQRIAQPTVAGAKT